MNIEKRRCFIINFIYFFIIGGITFVLLKYGLPFIGPFALAFIIAFLLDKPITFLSTKSGINRIFIAIASIILFYVIVGVLFALIGVSLFISIRDLFFQLPNLYLLEIQPVLIQLFDFLESSISKMDVSLLPTIDEVSFNLLQTLGDSVSNFSMKMIGIISNYASSLPALFIKILFTIISSFFFTVDYKKITHFLLQQLNEKHQKLIIEIKTYVINTLFKCILSYLFIMSITFVELFIGFKIIGLDKALLIALIIAIFDVLPVLGTGGIMIPWAILSALQKNYSLAIALFILYLFITIIRNILEPKIVGSQVGLHPVVTLMSLFVGAQLFGILGLFGLPIALSLLKRLNDQGTIHMLMDNKSLDL